MSHANTRAELSSVATSLDELTARVARSGEALDQKPTEGIALSLFEAERSLRSASRALARAVRDLR